MAGDEGQAPPAPGPEQVPQGDLDWVFTTVVDGGDGAPPPPAPPPADPPPPAPPQPAVDPEAAADLPQELRWMVGEMAATRETAHRAAEQLAELEARLAPLEARLAPLESVPTSIDALGRATRQELERCAGVLFGHDRALTDTRERVDALVARFEVAEARPMPEPGITAETAQMYDQALARVLDAVEGVTQRLVAMESRVQPLEPVPTVVAALRRAVRASDDLLAGEAGAREQGLAALASDVATQAEAREDAMRRLVAQDLDRVVTATTAHGQTLEDVARRVAAVEDRLAPLDSAPADIAALSRIMRRELDAVTADNQARDQMLRRALQAEIDQIQTVAAARDDVAKETVARVGAVEVGLGEATRAHDVAVATATGRLDALEAGMAAADALAGDLHALRELVRTEIDQLRSDARTHDQLMGEITRAFAALDGRLARFDPVPGELQSLRTALRQESERAVTQFRTLEERIGQLAWVPGEFQEARKRILALTTGLQADQDAVRALEAAVGSTNERLKALASRLAPPASGSGA